MNEVDVNRMVLLKAAAGIECANCQTCQNLGSEGDGYEYNGTWPVCDKIERMGYLKSFPFKKEMPKCWEPSFWSSKFADEITGDDAASELVFEKWREAMVAVENRENTRKF